MGKGKTLAAFSSFACFVFAAASAMSCFFFLSASAVRCFFALSADLFFATCAGEGRLSSSDVSPLREECEELFESEVLLFMPLRGRRSTSGDSEYAAKASVCMDAFASFSDMHFDESQNKFI